jgi:hypothetical protein
MAIGYYDRANCEVACRNCSWRGFGSQLEQGEVFRDVVEYDCPRCGARVTVVAFPTREETQAAADAGDAEAISALTRFDEAERRWERVQETRRSAVARLVELDDAHVRCALDLVHDEHGEAWIVLLANGRELHRELAAYESTEPAHRLLRLMRERHGDRLRSFDFGAAMLYLAGDRLRSLDELRQLVAGLPAGEG